MGPGKSGDLRAGLDGVFDHFGEKLRSLLDKLGVKLPELQSAPVPNSTVDRPPNQDTRYQVLEELNLPGRTL